MAKTVKHIDLKSYFGDEDHLEIAQKRSFTALVFETLSDRVPTDSELKVFELILNLSIDHGPDTPSTVKVIEAANAGKTISEAVSIGVSEINESHGGAVEPVMEVLYRIERGELEASNIVEQAVVEAKKIGGLGHRIYKTEDPRAQLILKTLSENGFDSKFADIAEDLRQEVTAKLGKDLPLNIDGAIAVALCSMSWEPKLGNAVFIIARTPGLCAHYLNNSK